MADINGGKFGEGLTVGAINEILIGQLSKLTKKDEKGKDVPLLSSEQMRWISALVGAGVSETVGGNAGQGGSIADSGTANNNLSHEEVKRHLENVDENSSEFKDWLNNMEGDLKEQGFDVNELTPQQKQQLVDLYKSMHLLNIYNQEQEFRTDIYSNVKDTVNDGAFVLANVAAIYVTVTDTQNAVTKVPAIYNVYSRVVMANEVVYTVFIDDSPVVDKGIHLTKEALLYVSANRAMKGVGEAYKDYWKENAHLLQSMGKSSFDVAVGSIFLENAGIGFINAISKAMK